MATRRQKTKHRRRATQHAQRSTLAPPGGWLSDDRWLAWTRDHGLDLSERDQLLDSVAVGLTVLCWRNTCLEDVHAGAERLQRLRRQGKDPDDPAVQADETRARRDHHDALDANWAVLADADPDESARINVLLDGRGQGFGIPDDVMMRLNISTAMDVRELLDQLLPESVTVAGTELGYDRRSVPDHVAAVVDLLQDPDRELTVGGTSITAGDVLGDTWDEYAEDVAGKVSAHVRVCDLVGASRALWYMGLSGILYASAWFPNPWWTRAVDLLRRAAVDSPMADAIRPGEWKTSVPLPEAEFWQTLLSTPARLSGPQCVWVQRSRLGEVIRAVRDTDRQRLGPLDDRERFSGFAAMF